MLEYMCAELLGTKFSLTIIAKDLCFEKTFIELLPPRPTKSPPTLLLFVTENSVQKRVSPEVKRWEKHQPAAIAT